MAGFKMWLQHIKHLQQQQIKKKYCNTVWHVRRVCSRRVFMIALFCVKLMRETLKLKTETKIKSKKVKSIQSVSQSVSQPDRMLCSPLGRYNAIELMFV